MTDNMQNEVCVYWQWSETLSGVCCGCVMDNIIHNTRYVCTGSGLSGVCVCVVCDDPDGQQIIHNTRYVYGVVAVF